MDFDLHYFGSKVVEDGNFQILRPEGSPRYIFFHFISSVQEVDTAEGTVFANPGACILYTPIFPQRLSTGEVRLSHDYLDFTTDDPSFFTAIKFPLNTIFNPNMSHRISDTVALIKTIKETNPIGGDYEISNSISSLFIDMARKIHRHLVGENKEYSEQLKASFEDLRVAVFENPSEVTVESLAKKMDFSNAYFSTIYRKYFKTSPIDDIKKAKMSKVQDLILSGEKSSSVAKSMGFRSVEYFYRWFKSCFNCTPRQFAEGKTKNEKRPKL